MSYRSALENKNRTIRVTAISAATASGSESISLTIGPWPKQAILGKLIISANNTVPGLTATVVTDGASYLSTSDPTMVQGIQTGNVSSTSLPLEMQFDEYVIDALQEGYLYVILTSTAPFTTGTVFKIIAEGERTLNQYALQGEHTFTPGDKSWRVLSVVGGATTDVTQAMKNNGKPNMNFGQPFQPGTTVLTSTSDYIYIGSTLRFPGFNVTLASGAAQPSGESMTAQYWNGAWTSLTGILDNTSDGQASPSSFSYSGTMKFAAPSDWAISQISTDPLYLMQQQVDAYNSPVPNFLYNPNRFWIRIKLSAVSPTLDLLSLTPTF